MLDGPASGAWVAPISPALTPRTLLGSLWPRAESQVAQGDTLHAPKPPGLLLPTYPSLS